MSQTGAAAARSASSTFKPRPFRVKLRGSSYLMLGMLRLGARSGYAIKKLADISTAHFWPTSLAQVYPELAALEQAGLSVRTIRNLESGSGQPQLRSMRSLTAVVSMPID